MTMSRDFILVFSGGVVSLMTTLVVLFVIDYFYRRDQKAQADQIPSSAADRQAIQTIATPPASQTKTVEPAVQKPAVGQKPQPAVVEPPAPKPAMIEPASPAQVVDQPVQAPMVEQAQPAVVEPPAPKPAVIEPASPAQVVDQPVQAPMVEQAQPAVVEPPAPKPAVIEPASPAQVVDQPVQAPMVEQAQPAVDTKPSVKDKTRPVVVETPVAAQPKPHVADEPVKKTVAEKKPKPKAVDATSQPPRVSPPETMRKKADGSDSGK